MKTLHFETSINAPAKKVYDIMLNEETFKQWTAEFSPTSRYKGSWDKGSKIIFLSDDEKGNVCGMVSRIKENLPNEFVSIEHYGSLEDGKEITEGEKIEAFAGMLEEYTYLPTENGTLLKVAMDTTTEWEAYFNQTWPKALNKIKTICEAS